MAEKKAKKKTKQQISMVGSIAFGVGLAIAVFSGALGIDSPLSKQIIGATLMVLGLVVGALNITREESMKFMISSIVIVTLIQPLLSAVIDMFAINSQAIIGMLRDTFVNIAMFVVPAAVLVAVKTAFEVAKDDN